MKLYGFLKARNEVSGGNIYRVLDNMAAVGLDGAVILDDASTDGTTRVLEDFVNAQKSGWWTLIKVPPEKHDFSRELFFKERMLQEIHGSDVKPDWIFWWDADEQLDANGTKNLRRWLETDPACPSGAFRFHYTQLWINTSWARTDSSFDEGWYLKCWKYRPDLTFDVKSGTHHAQFPKPINPAGQDVAPFELVHWGNASPKALVRKAAQYSGGRGGVDRHVAFGHMPRESMATGEGWDQAKYSEPNPMYREVDPAIFPPGTERFPGPKPTPFSLEHIKRIRSLGNMRDLKETFCVVVPAYNRARTLPKALDSLLFQTHEKWVALVLDDGSTDDTAAVMRRYEALDPRIFYLRYPTNRGGVAMNEIGMSMACEIAEWWSRLGSDDWFGPSKLALDARALREHEACYGLYTVVRRGDFGEICNPPLAPETIRAMLLGGRYVVSWANIAVRTSALRKVKARFGNFVDPRLRNCEDFSLNARLVSLGVDFRWRGPEGVDPTPLPGTNAWDSRLASPELEAVWTCADAGGASSPENAAILANDEMLTRQLIAQMSLQP